MKKVGLITMHKVPNYGSALQAYALQEVIKTLGYEVEIIDYKYPNEYHATLKKEASILLRIALFIIQLVYGFPQRRRNKLFKRFYDRFFKLSKNEYMSKDSLQESPPQYDIYVTGSDQVWNANYIGNDTTFMLSFISGKPKISYASSFASDTIPDVYKDLYSTYLTEYNYLSVREKNGKKIIYELLGRDSAVVLDPTILLSSSQYDKLAEESIISYTEPYILAYILAYSFDPYPYVEEFIDSLQRKMDIKVYFLSVSNTKMLFKHNSKRMQIVGPCEFVSLFRNASFVITTSFHGTAFSINYKKPFYSIIDKNGDDRIISLLEMVGLEDRAIYKGDAFPNDISFEYTDLRCEKLQELKELSINYLREALSNSI